MNHHDAEITDVVVVLDCRDQKAVEDSVAKCKSLGMEVVEINVEEGVIEGSIESTRVPELKTIPSVSYIRSVFTYIADYPTTDPRDKDGAEESPDDAD
jgi:hypothetical protein